MGAFAFGAHCSNSLHGFSNKDKYVTSYFFTFFFVVLLWLASAFFELLDIWAAGAAFPFADAVPVFLFEVDLAVVFFWPVCVALPLELAPADVD